MPEKFDVIVVGAGLAGTTAALILAQAGLNVAVFERGERPGGKNVSGGILFYTEILEKIIPEFWDIAPIERYVTKHALVFTSGKASTTVTFSDQEFAQIPYNGITLLRAKFDSWFSEKAREAGALIIPETLVTGFLYKNGRISGIQTAREEGRVISDGVIIAEGANSVLVQGAGFGREPSPEDFAVGAKEILALPPQVIEERFNLQGNEGAGYVFTGDCIQGLEGGGFLYTNRSTLSAGVVVRLSSLQRQKRSIADVLEVFKADSSVKPLLSGGLLKEYSCHMIPEGGLRSSPAFFGDHVLVAGDAAGFVCSTGLTLQGMNFAIASGFAAAETLKSAKLENDFSKRSLSRYEKFLQESFVLPTLHTFRNTPAFLSNPRLYSTYPSILCGFLRKIFRSDDQPRKKWLALMMDEMRGKISLWQLLKDILRGARALLW